MRVAESLAALRIQLAWRAAAGRLIPASRAAAVRARFLRLHCGWLLRRARRARIAEAFGAIRIQRAFRAFVARRA